MPPTSPQATPAPAPPTLHGTAPVPLTEEARPPGRAEVGGRPDRMRRLRRLSPTEWRHVAAMGTVIVGLHAAGWGIFLLAVLPLHDGALGIGVALTAYTLGMRHAFDADHIAAIDNTTRLLQSRGQRPLSVGFWFSLGHSSVVFAVGVALTVAARAVFHAVADPRSALQGFGGAFGAGISGVFLYAIAFANLVVLAGLVKAFRRMRHGVYDEAELERQLDQRGMMNRFFGRLLRSISRPARMYPVGVLFGLGFDTATEVALLAATAGAAESRLPWFAVLSLPLVFAAGMTLFDTLDGTFMNVAYGWAFARPVRKAYYSITVTGLSVAVAFVVGTVELLALVADQAHLGGPFWSTMGRLDLNTAGMVIVGMFVAAWALAVGVWHFGRIEDRWRHGAAGAGQDGARSSPIQT